MTLRRVHQAHDSQILVTVEGGYVEVAVRPDCYARWSAPLPVVLTDDDKPSADIADRLASYDPDFSDGGVPREALAEILRLRAALSVATAALIHYDAWFGDECRCSDDPCPIATWGQS